MSLILKDRCKQKVAANAGTNSITLTTAVTGFKTISSTLSNGDSSYFCLESGSSWEVFIGTYTSSTTTVSRDTVLASSNSGNKIDIGSGITVCYIVYPADKATYKDGSGRIVSGAAGIIFSDASIQTTAATTPDLSAYAPLASPTFTGTPAAPTATSGTNTTQLATTAFVASAVGSIDLTPYALLPDTLPAVGTLLSYGGNRQLAAGGTVTHGGALNISRTTGSNDTKVWSVSDGGAERLGLYWQFGYPELVVGSNTSIVKDTTFQLGSIGLRLGSASGGAIHFGQYANSTLDVSIRRGGSGIISIRNAADSADAALTCGAITASEMLISSNTGTMGFEARYASERNALLDAYGLHLYSAASISFSSSATSHLSTRDLYLGRNAAGVLQIGTTSNNALGSLACGAITASGAITVTSGSVVSNTGMFQALASGQNMFLLNSAGTSYGSIGNDAGDKWSLGYKASSSTALGTPVLTWTVAGFVGINKVSPTVALDVNGAITASGNLLVNAAYTSSVPQSILRGTAGVAAYRLQTSDTGSANTDGFGIELSTTTAYLWNYENASLVLGTNNTTCLTLAASGAATFAGAITASGAATISGLLTLPAGFRSNDRSLFDGVLSIGGSLTASLIHPSAMRATWTNTSLWSGTIDTAIGRDSAGVIGLYTSDSGSTKAALTCGAITASGNLTLTGTGNGIFLNSGGSARGIIYFSTNENRLYSASYPWVVESDQGFKVRNAANNADAALTCGAITASGQITEVPPSSVTLSTNGQFSIEMTSDTAGNLVYRGSDGVTRRCALVFA